MCKSGQFYKNSTWVIPLRFVGIDLMMGASMWKIKMCPHDILMGDISNVFFGTITRMTNMRYLNVQ